MHPCMEYVETCMFHVQNFQQGTLVHVHIATEVLETLHPGATGLCLIIKIWLVTLTDEMHWPDVVGMVNFALLSAYWVLSAYFLAVLKISVCTY